MEIAVTPIVCESVRQTFEIHHLTDCHIDAPDFAETELLERIAHIEATPNAYWVGGGDYWSLILHNDKRFNGVVRADYRDALHAYPERCLERGLELFGPIAKKCLGLGAGNHEATVGKYYHRGLAAEFAAKLGRPDLYLGDRGWVVIPFSFFKRKMTLRGYQYHGWSSGRLRGRKGLHAERDIGAWNADFIFLGHDHQPYHEVFYTEEVFNPGGRGAGWRTRQIPRAIVNGGSWTYGQKPPTPEETKKGWSVSEMPAQSWAEGKNFRPQPPVCPWLMVDVDFGHADERASESAAARSPKRGVHSGRPASFSFDVRFPTPTFFPGGDGE